jgi:trimeric autotransporter adhesin
MEESHLSVQNRPCAWRINPIFFSLLFLALLQAAFVSFSSPGFAIPPDRPSANTWYANGSVSSILPAGPITYIAGSFTYVGPKTGGGAPVHAITGNVFPSNLNINGDIYAAAPDGLGGWYLGGNFTRVDGVARNNIAHVQRDGALDPAWDPNSNYMVSAIVVNGSTIYAGGSFTQIGGQNRSRIAALDAATGLATPWNPEVNNPVQCLALSGGVLYVGGGFSRVGGQERNNIAAVDAATGAVTAWNPNASGAVWTIVVSGGLVYTGGGFGSIGGQTRDRLAALDAVSGNATAWNPAPNGDVYAIAVSGNVVYIGGFFTNIGGQNRTCLAAVNAATGQATAWNPNCDNFVRAVLVNGNTIYVGGNFTNIGGLPRNYLAALDAATASATSWEPLLPFYTGTGNSAVYTLVLDDEALYVGGHFSSIGGKPRYRLAAIDKATGRVTSWNPAWVNDEISAISLGEDAIYIGGPFTLVDSQVKNYLAAIDTTTGALTPWEANANNIVNALAIDGSTLYVSGGFTSIGGQSRHYMAALDTATGLANGWNPNPNFGVLTMALGHGVVYAGAYFSQIGGAAKNRLAALDPVTGTATSWDPNPNGTVKTLVVKENLVWTGGEFGSIRNIERAGIAAIDATTGLPTSFNAAMDILGIFTVNSLALEEGVVYVGGAFTRIGGQDRYHLAALDEATGTATSWNPRINTHGEVYKIAADGPVVYVGGYFTAMGGESQPNLAQFGELPKQTIDFNGDGNPDLVWRNKETGRTTIWFMDGAKWNGGFADIEPTVTDISWSLVGIADFNGDGNPDLLWRNSDTGITTIWYMDGATWNGGYANIEPTIADTKWSIVGLADFNGDGNIDLLWRNAESGRTTIWYMTGPKWNGDYADVRPTVVGSNWSIVGIADFNGDSNPDLLWRNSSDGTAIIWYMTGPNWNGGHAQVLPTLNDPNWSIAAVRDFNRDGSPDLLWRNTSADPGDPNRYRTTVWYMDGPVWNGNWGDLPLFFPSSDWIVIGK